MTKYTDCAEIISGGTPKTSIPEYWNGDIPWLSVVDFNTGDKYVYATEKTITQDGLDNSSTKLLQKNDIIISARGTVGAMAMLPFPMAFNQSCFGIRAKKEIVDADYLFYATKCKIEELKQKSKTGNVFKSINLDTFEMLELNLPSLKEQKKIAATLSTLDDKISLNEQINRNLEELARLIYDYWFVQFDFPDKNGKPYKSSGGKMVWNETLKREIPEGWQLKRIEDVCERIQSGGTPATSRKDLYDGSLNWFSTQELQDNFLFDSIKHISPNALKESSAKLFPKDTILIAIYAAPTVGRLGILTEDSAFNQACCGFVVNKETVSKEYLFLHLKQSRDKLNTLSGGTAQKNLNVGKMQNFEILVPPYEIMDLFTHQVGKMFDKIKQTSEESKNLTNLRDFLLPLLMNGQVSLRG